MAGIRMTGLASGLDTESLVGELSKAYQKRVDNAKKSQTKAEWKKTAWASLNTKLTNFYKGALSTFKTSGTYNAKSIVGDLKGVKVTAGNKAANGTHKVKVTDVASAQMWTGNKISNRSVDATSYESVTNDQTLLSDLKDANGYSIANSLNGRSFKVSSSAGEREINIDLSTDFGADAKVSDLVDNINSQLDGTGLTASFENGQLKFANSNPLVDSDELDETGAPIKKAGESIKLTALDEETSRLFGISTDGTDVPASPDDTGTGNTISTSTFAYEKKVTTGASISSSTKLTDLGIAEGTRISVNGHDIEINRTTTLASLAGEMAGQGINANYDAGQGRFYLSSTNTGSDNAFTVDADQKTLKALGLDFSEETMNSLAANERGKKIDASDASIEYNGVTYTQSSNSFSINGLTFDVTAKGDEMDFSVSTDTDGIYDKVKNFVKEYNSLMKEMSDLYYAESSRGYDPLTSEEKDAMTDDEVKEWEDKIKKSLLRRDDTISTLLSNMRSILNKSVDVTNSDGSISKYSLSSFGINTGAWNERGLLHIDGDQDDATVSGLDDKLKAAIAKNPEAVQKTLSSLGNDLYSFLMKAQAKTTTSSSQTFYNDLTLDADIKTQKENVKKMQEKQTAEEDKYYKQFSAMESAMAKLQSQQSYLSGLFGGM